jgi:hypothetical protein
MIEKKHKNFEGGLVGEVFGLWKEDWEEFKNNAASAAQVAELEAKLKAAESHQAQSAKKVLARCGAASEMGLRDMCFHEWVSFHQEYLKNKDFEDKVKLAEKQFAEFQKSKSAGAQSILNKMHNASEHGLLDSCVKGWAEIVQEEKRIQEFAEQMNGAQGRLGGFGERNKKSAKNAMERAHEHQLTMLYLHTFGAWRMETLMERMEKHHKGRLDGKKQQLLGVQQMFRNFAVQLENNIQAGADSNRDLSQGPPASYKKQYTRGMTRTEASLSLPDIHAKPGSGASRSTITNVAR